MLLVPVFAATASASSISYVQGNFGISTSKRTVTVKYKTTQVGGDVNIVIVGWNDTTTTVKAVTDSAGNVYSLAAGPTVGKLLSQSIYIAKNIVPSAANAVTIAFSKSAYYPDIRILEYSGADPNSPVDGVGANSSNSSISTTAVITTNDTDLIIGANIVRGTTTGPGSGFTQRMLTRWGDIAEDRMVNTAGNYTATAPLNASSSWVMQAVSLRTPITIGSNPAQPIPTALSCANSSMTGAGTDTCTVSLNAAATSGGLAVALASNNAAVSVPAAVTVPAGATSATFAASVASVSTNQTTTLTASANNSIQSFALQLMPVVATLSVNATNVAFGDVQLNTIATQSLTLTSAGSAAVTISSAAITGSGFSYTGVSFPITLNPKQAAILSVAFDPTVAGTATGQLTISSNSSLNPKAVVSLSGIGQANTYSVSITWQAPSSSSDPVAGYHVYRSPSGSSSYQLLSSVTNSQLNYADSSVQNGQSYDYIVESVDTSGSESSPSNTATVTIP